MALYIDQYALFGDPEVLPVKVIWDYAIYWGVLAQFFFHNRLTDLTTMAALRDEMARCQRLNLEVQSFLRAWSGKSLKRNVPTMLDQASIPWFAELNRSLNDELDATQFAERIRHSSAQLHTLAREILERALEDHPGLDGEELRRLTEPTASQTRRMPAGGERMLPDFAVATA